MELPIFNYNYTNEGKGQKKDLEVVRDERWLGNSLVGYMVDEQNGEWLISLIFISNDNPLKFAIRRLERHHSVEKANQYSMLSQKTARMLQPCYQSFSN
ncbi:hypothetical protein [Flectobacillus rivi]|uniref:Uncharacterized protein n=1 Tax=Flectobacillus rivi TaxID=2984209 RepID=A0ABT6Z5U6_9BACT|nr:hypothetical protein [Flectobacillus rivi]MDI9875979.1 hypothetical protein [Flectobacillus rivi]